MEKFHGKGMIHLVRVILISVVLIVYSRQGATQSYFSRTGLDYETMKTKYKDVPLHGGTDIEGFVVGIKDIDSDDQIKSARVTGHVACQPFIDENGEVETIFIINSMNNHVDSLAIESLKQSKFKPLQISGKLTKYSCIVKYHFSDGLMLYPSVNDITINVPEKQYYELTKKPEVVRQAKPEYPDSARMAGVEGRVILRVLINAEGNVEKVEVVKGIRSLNKSASESLYQWKFIPGEYEGRPVKVWMKVPIDYKIKR